LEVSYSMSDIVVPSGWSEHSYSTSVDLSGFSFVTGALPNYSFNSVSNVVCEGTPAEKPEDYSKSIDGKPVISCMRIMV